MCEKSGDLSQVNVLKGPSIKCVCKILRKTNISNPLIRTRTCAYQKVRNVGFSEILLTYLMDDPKSWFHFSKGFKKNANCVYFTNFANLSNF